MPNPYETKRYLDEYLLFHFGTARELCPFNFVPRSFLRFHERIRSECIIPIERFNATTCALDIGCAVGRFTFELGRVVDRAIGIDNSESFIRAARRLGRNPSVTVRIKESGAAYATRTLTVPKPLRAGNVKFRVGDALALAAHEHSRFEIVAALNLLCRLADPEAFLHQVSSLIAPRGQLILSSPFSWLEEYTPRSKWLSPMDVQDCLRAEFHLAKRRDIPFMIREHRRKYQLVAADVMTFRKR